MGRAARFGLAAVLMLVAAVGCDAQAEDKEAIRASWETIDEANKSSNGEVAAAHFTSGSLARYPRLIKLALDGKKAELDKLDAWDLSEVLRMRTLSTRKDLEGLDGRAYVVYATSKGWYSWGDGPPEECRGIRIAGDSAVVYFYSEGEQTGESGRFEREDGVWKFDEESWRPTFNGYVREAAMEEGVTMPEFLISLIEEQSGVTPPATIWSPMRK